jgi:hypothetical protein
LTTGLPAACPRVAVTGHRDLTERTTHLVSSAIHAALAPYGPNLVGISCLAPGADQIFARTVLELGGRLHAIVAASGYRATLSPDARRTYDELLHRAEWVDTLTLGPPVPASYATANEVMLGAADHLIAVWDGRPARGRGGTAEAVEEARRRAIRVDVMWPRGALRGTPVGAPR